MSRRSCYNPQTGDLSQSPPFDTQLATRNVSRLDMAAKPPQPGTGDPAGPVVALLGVGPAEAFRDRLAAVFFDPDAKRTLVHEIREAIRQSAQRARREPAEVEDDILTALMA